MGTQAIVEMVGGLLMALVRVAPGIAVIFTGGQDVEETIRKAREAALALPVRTGPGGSWDRDLEQRLRRPGDL